jgi:hypothetical protein
MPEKLPGDPSLPPGVTDRDIEPDRFLCRGCGFEITYQEHEQLEGFCCLCAEKPKQENQ